MTKTQIDCLRRYIADNPKLSNRALAQVVVEQSDTFKGYSAGSVANYLGRVKKMDPKTVDTKPGTVAEPTPAASPTEIVYITFGGMGQAKNEDIVIKTISELTSLQPAYFIEKLSEASQAHPLVFGMDEESAQELYEALFGFGCHVGVAQIAAKEEVEESSRPSQGELWNNSGSSFDPRSEVTANIPSDAAVGADARGERVEQDRYMQENPVLPKHTDVLLIAARDIHEGVNISDYIKALDRNCTPRIFVFGDECREATADAYDNLHPAYGGIGTRMVEAESTDEYGWPTTEMVKGGTWEEYKIYDAIDSCIAELLRTTGEEDVTLTIIADRGVDFGSRYSNTHIIELINKCKNNLGWCISLMTSEGDPITNALSIGVDSSNSMQMCNVQEGIKIAARARKERNINMASMATLSPVGYFTF